MIVSEGLVALVPPEHPLAKQATVTLADIAAHPLVGMPEGTGIRTVFDRACASRRIQPAIACQASAADAIADLAARGLGVAILTGSTSTPYENRLKARRITDIESPALLALIWTVTRSPALERLIRHSRESFTVA